ncbi:MAG TPA: hypothetical protein VJS44_08410 [Pyrinomonadaceae bacterium]|nr:hypothetical protein [Pyrinomonadaceae bacterium]
MNKVTRLVASLLLVACLACTTIMAQSGSVTTVMKAPTTSAVKLVDADSSTSSVLIVNNGSVTAYVGTTSSVTASASASTDGIPVYANTYLVLRNVSNSLYGITASGTANLRITVAKNGASIDSGRLQTTGIANGAAAGYVPMSNGSDMVAGNVLIKLVTSAITANSTSCSDAAGSLAITSNATGLGTVFRCDGTTYQLLNNYSAFNHQSDTVTVATTGNTDAYVVTGYAGTLAGVDCSGIDALAASDTNYITFSLTNLGQAGAGSAAMLAATAANTTQATGGTALSANTKRSLTLSGTGANLIVAAGDRLRLRSAATGTLAGTVSGFKCTLKFTRLS